MLPSPLSSESGEREGEVGRKQIVATGVRGMEAEE